MSDELLEDAPYLPAQVMPGYTQQRFAAPAPTAAEIEEVKRFIIGQRDELQQRVAELEGLLGFISTADDLAVRVSRLEIFLKGK